MQNMWDILAKTLEYRSKYIHILNPTVREDIVHPLTAVTNCQICVRLKKAAERTKSRGCLFKVVDTRGPANFGVFVMRRRSASRLTRTPLACRRWQHSSILFFSIKYSRLLYFCDVRCGYYVLQKSRNVNDHVALQLQSMSTECNIHEQSWRENGGHRVGRSLSP